MKLYTVESNGPAQYTEVPGFTGLAPLALPAHRRIIVGRYHVGLSRPSLALPWPVAERLRIHTNTGVWRRLAVMLTSACFLAGVKALLSSACLASAEGCGRAHYKASRRCFSQPQVVDYARATCFVGTPALSGCHLAEGTASLSQQDVLCTCSKLPSCCLNTLSALIHISFILRSVLSPKLQVLLHFQLSIAFRSNSTIA